MKIINAVGRLSVRTCVGMPGDGRTRRNEADHKVRSRTNRVRSVSSGRPNNSSPASLSKNSALEARRATDMAVSHQEKQLEKKKLKIEKYLKKREIEEACERERNIGVVRVKAGVDRVMLTIILTLLCLGTIMVFSASYPSALAYKNDSLYFIKRQSIFACVGIGIIITDCP